MGYALAGYKVTGVDIVPRPRYPFAFVLGDALEYLESHGHEYDLIHASPPCQGYSHLTPAKNRGDHAKLIPAVRELVKRLGKPYVIENVAGARHELENPVMLCGSMFGLRTQRHRYFETNIEVRNKRGSGNLVAFGSRTITVGSGMPRARATISAATGDHD